MSWNRGKVKYPENPPLGKWQPPKLNRPLSWNQIKRLWYLRCELQKRGIKLRKRGVHNIAEQLAGVLRQLDDEFGEYDDYDLKDETDQVNRAWHKANHTLMVTTWPLVPTGRIPFEVRAHDWFRDNVGLKLIYRLQATLWYKATYWGFQQWRDYIYQKYWYKRLDEEAGWDDWDEWECDYYEQRRLFLHWFELLGYTGGEAWKIHKNWNLHINE